MVSYSITNANRDFNEKTSLIHIKKIITKKKTILLVN